MLETNQRNTGGGGQATDELIGGFGHFLWVDPAQALKEKGWSTENRGGKGGKEKLGKLNPHGMGPARRRVEQRAGGGSA